MTGYASLTGETGVLRYDWDVRSVNGKGLDVRLRIPDGIEGLEPRIREVAKSRLTRGNVTVTVRLTPVSSGQRAPLESERLASALETIRIVRDAAKAAKIELAPSSVADVLAVPGLFASDGEPDDRAKAAILGEVEAAFDALAVMRGKEGAALGDILNRSLDAMDANLKAAQETAEARAAAQGDLLRQKVKDVLGASDLPDPARLAQELATLAVKADVTEELDRLEAHIAAAREMLQKGGPVGRKLDFLMQEFNREANTLCSKSGSQDLTAIGLEMKVIIDQMREQVQNLE